MRGGNTDRSESPAAARSIGLEVVLAAHGEAESAGFFENWRVGQRTLAHSAEVMHLPAPLRWLICTLGALRKRLANRPGSPHNQWSRAQATALAERLSALLGEPVTVRAAFAASHPSAAAWLAGPAAARHRVAVSMSPSDSRLSCGLLCRALARAETESAHTQVLARLWDDPEFAALNARHVRAAVTAWPPDSGSCPASASALLLVFHGTLVKDRRGRTPGFHAGLAEKQHFAGALKAALAAQAHCLWDTVEIAYLNHEVAGQWTQPSVAAALGALHARCIRRVWVFACDFLVEGGEINGSLKQSLVTGPIADTRLLPCLNHSPDFIDYLARRIQRALDQPQARWQCDACPRSSMQSS